MEECKEIHKETRKEACEEARLAICTEIGVG